MISSKSLLELIHLPQKNHSSPSISGTRQLSPNSSLSLNSILIYSFLQAPDIFTSRRIESVRETELAGASTPCCCCRLGTEETTIESEYGLQFLALDKCNWVPTAIVISPKNVHPHHTEYSNKSYCILFCVFNSLVLIAL